MRVRAIGVFVSYVTATSKYHNGVTDGAQSVAAGE
jgi:hypothetical protein